MFAKIGEALKHNRVRFLRQPTFIDNNMMAAVPDRSKIKSTYLFHTLRTFKFSAFNQGTSVPYLTATALGAVVVRLPGLEEQRRIAGILSAYDDLIAVNERRIAVLEEMARRVFERRFTDPAVDRSEWRDATLADWVAEERQSVSPDQLEPTTPYLGLEHLPRRSTTLAEWGDVATVTSTKSRFLHGDILFGKIRPYFHKVVHAPFDGVSSSDAIVLRPVSADHRAAALGLCSSDAFIDHATQSSNGTKMPRANWKVLKETKLPVPPNDVLNKYNAVAVPLIEWPDTLARQNANLRTTRDLLLPRLISGEIDVADAPFPATTTAATPLAAE